MKSLHKKIRNKISDKIDDLLYRKINDNIRYKILEKVSSGSNYFYKIYWSLRI
jgi:mRNA-degrading endonuclease RelE of RelBE toxin-antitoxin system